jgi:hypothetical protein
MSTQTSKGVTARLMYYDDFTRSYRLKTPYSMALWVLGLGMVLGWIVLIW